MKFHINAEIEIDIDDHWLQKTWQQHPVNDQDADALELAIEALREAVSPPRPANTLDPLSIKLKEWKRRE